MILNKIYQIRRFVRSSDGELVVHGIRSMDRSDVGSNPTEHM